MFFSVAIYISVGSTLPYTEHSCIYICRFWSMKIIRTYRTQSMYSILFSRMTTFFRSFANANLNDRKNVFAMIVKVYKRLLNKIDYDWKMNAWKVKFFLNSFELKSIFSVTQRETKELLWLCINYIVSGFSFPRWVVNTNPSK